MRCEDGAGGSDGVEVCRGDVAVFYIVKWKPRGFAETAEFTHRFATVTDAILEAACAILDKRPDDVWIENQAGMRVANAEQIAEYCLPVRQGIAPGRPPG